ncbi:unnamed protein product [Calypogeia fissa]
MEGGQHADDYLDIFRKEVGSIPRPNSYPDSFRENIQLLRSTLMEKQRNVARKDAAGPRSVIYNSMNAVLLGVVMFLLLVDSVAATSRSLPGYDINSRAEVVSGLGSFTSHQTMIKRNLLQDGGFEDPPPGGGPPESGDVPPPSS